MGMTETRTSDYINAIKEFNQAVDNDDFKTAKAHF